MGKFSQKHYEAIGEALRKVQSKPFICMQTIDKVFEGFARMFEEDNRNFSYTKFYHKVWGGGEESGK